VALITGNLIKLYGAAGVSCMTMGVAYDHGISTGQRFTNRPHPRKQLAPDGAGTDAVLENRTVANDDHAAGLG